MRILRHIATPWAPYSTMFSRDGSRIAIGGGTWYGYGGILLADLSTGRAELFPCADLPEDCGGGYITVSGICFSADDRHLAASTWRYGHHYNPTLLFEASELNLRYRATLVQRFEDKYRDPCPTGVLLHGGHAITRNNAGKPGDMIAVWKSPEWLGIKADGLPQHLTSSQMVVLRESVITGNGDSLLLVEWRRDADGHESGKAADGLVFQSLENWMQGYSALPVADCRRITAIAALPSGAGFITGGLDGELDRWYWENGWKQQRLQRTMENRTVDFPHIVWATYTPNSIVGICSLCDGQRWVTVSAGGEARLWNGDTLTNTWQLPEPGSPRSLAAHPAKPWIAVGIKKGGFGSPGSAVLLAEIDP